MQTQEGKCTLNVLKIKLLNKSTLLYLAVFSFFVISIFQILTPIADISNVLLYDESVSLSNGYNATFDLKDYESSPIYSLYYRLISVFVADPLAGYYVNHISLLVGLIFTLCLFAFIQTRALFIALFFCSLIIVLKMHNVWPRVNYLTAILIILSFVLIVQKDSLLEKLYIATLSSYLLVFIRPEFYLSFYLCLLMVVILAIKQEISGFIAEKQFSIMQVIKRNRVFFLICLLLTFFVMPLPSDSARAFVAFGQHYSLNIHKQEALTTDPWITWQAVVFRDFGNIDSIKSALQANPMAIYRHIQSNILKIFIPLTVLMMIYCILLVAFIKKRLPEDSIKIKHNTLILLVFMIPVLMANFIIYPRLHYLFLLFCLILIGYLIVIPKLKPTSKLIKIDMVLSVLLIFGLLIFPPDIKREKPDQEAIIIKQLKNSEQDFRLGNVLEIDGGWCYYLNSCNNIYSETNKSLQWYQSHINSIIVSPRLILNAQAQPILKLIDDSAKYKFKKQELYDGYFLLINEN